MDWWIIVLIVVLGICGLMIVGGLVGLFGIAIADYLDPIEPDV